MSIEKIRKIGLMILACVFGMVIIQLAAPIILGILVQGMALVVPLAVYHFFVREKWRFKLVRGNGDTCEESQAKGKISNESESGFMDWKPNPSSEREKSLERAMDSDQEIQETVSGDETPERNTAKSRQTAVWYEEVGKAKIMAVAMKLTKKEIGEFWIRKDGICSFRTGKGYRRAGTIPGFSEADRETLVRLLDDEGFMAEDQGKYLYLTWAV